MPLPAAAHQAVQAETKRRRNAAARANRVRVAGVRVLRATDDAGAEYTLALGDKEPSRAYVLRRGKDGAWTCDCFVNRWQRRCAHLEAVEAAGEGDVAGEKTLLAEWRAVPGVEQREDEHRHHQHRDDPPPPRGLGRVHEAPTMHVGGQPALVGAKAGGGAEAGPLRDRRHGLPEHEGQEEQGHRDQGRDDPGAPGGSVHRAGPVHGVGQPAGGLEEGGA